jgi:hypothetical protein
MLKGKQLVWKNRLFVARVLFLLVGTILVIMGIWFIIIRPTFVLLPEDESFTGVSTSDLQKTYPGLFSWIGLVFRSWGSFIVGGGVYIIFLGFFGLRSKQKWAWFALLFGGVSNLTIFSIVNYILHGDYLVLIVGLLVGTAFGLLLSFKSIFSSIT